MTAAVAVLAAAAVVVLAAAVVEVVDIAVAAAALECSRLIFSHSF